MAGDPYRYFRIEARELSDDLARGLLDLERGSDSGSPSGSDIGSDSATDSGAMLAGVLRTAHTLKGAARVVRQGAIAAAAHALEDALEPYRGNPAAIPPAAIAEALTQVDAIDAGIVALPPADAGTAPSAPATAVPTSDATGAAGAPTAGQRPGDVGTTDAAAGHAAASPDPPTVMRTDSTDIDDLLEAIGEAQTHLSPLRRGIAELDRIRRGFDLLRAQLDAPAPADAADGSERLRRIAAALGGDLATVTHDLARSVEHGERELRQIRVGAEQLRLVRAGSVFPALHRAARDAAAEIGCLVRFDGTGGDTRLDPQVLSTVYGALLHVVRNAVAHGIEPAEQRRSAGKPDEGRVTVAVGRRGARIVFSCSDDGRGIDIDAVRRAGAGAGIDTGALDPAGITGLVMRAGISTAAQVTELAGRGVGLDAVRDAAIRLGGDVAVTSVPGRGTTVDVTVPLSLLAVDCLIVHAAGTTAAVPLDAVRQCLRLDDAGATGTTVRYGAHTVPYLPLAAALASRQQFAATDPAVAMIVSGTDGTAAIGVDRVVDVATVVLRAVPALAPAGAIVGGLCLDGDGNPRIVLDPAGLVAAASTGHGTGPTTPAAVRRPVLVVDDSLTTRMLERSILEAAGYDVDVAASGEEGLAKARRNRYGLFLVDVEMPGMDGFTFIEHTRTDPDLQHIPSILVSSRASPADRDRGRQAGAAVHVAKGAFDQTELLEHVGRLVVCE